MKIVDPNKKNVEDWMGEVEDMIVCENIVDHLVGNVYIKFTSEEYAERCFVSL